MNGNHHPQATDPSRTVLLGTDLEAIPTTPHDNGAPRADLVVGGLIAQLTGNFRTDDRLSLREGRHLLLVCSIAEQADAGPLADRFRSLLQAWATATDTDTDTQHERPTGIRITIGLYQDTSSALLSRLDRNRQPSGSSSSAHRPDIDHL